MRPCDRRDLTFCRNQTENNKKKSPRAASSRSPSLLQRVSSIAAAPVTQGCANEAAARLRFGVLHQVGHLGWIPAALCRGWRSAGSPLVCATRPQSANGPGSGAGADSRSKPCGAHVLLRLRSGDVSHACPRSTNSIFIMDFPLISAQLAPNHLKNSAAPL